MQCQGQLLCHFQVCDQRIIVHTHPQTPTYKPHTPQQTDRYIGASILHSGADDMSISFL